MAPEIVTGKGYGLAVDYWSLGVMVFEFLYGIFPFGNDLDDPFAIYQAIVVGKLNFPDKIKSTESAKKIIELLLTKNPAIR